MLEFPAPAKASFSGVIGGVKYPLGIVDGYWGFWGVASPISPLYGLSCSEGVSAAGVGGV